LRQESKNQEEAHAEEGGMKFLHQMSGCSHDFRNYIAGMEKRGRENSCIVVRSTVPLA
jgi:hypothetical protein